MWCFFAHFFSRLAARVERRLDMYARELPKKENSSNQLEPVEDERDLPLMPVQELRQTKKKTGKALKRLLARIAAVAAASFACRTLANISAFHPAFLLLTVIFSLLPWHADCVTVDTSRRPQNYRDRLKQTYCPI